MIGSLRTKLSPLPGLGRRILLAGLVAVAGIWGHFAIELRGEHEAAMAGGAASTASLTAAFREHLRRTLTAIDQIMVAMKDDFAEEPETYQLPKWIGRSAFLSGLSLQVALVGADGRVRQSNLGPEGYGVDLSDRPHIRHHFAADAEQPYISVPVLGRVSGRWSVQISRRLERQDGSFGGVLVVSLDPTQLANLFDSVQLGTEGFAMVVGRDRVVRAAQGPMTNGIGRTLPPGERLSVAIVGAPQGTFQGSGGLDGIERIVSYATVPNLPLIVVVGRSMEEILAPVWREGLSNAAVSAAMSLAVIFLMAMLMAEVRRRRDNEVKLAENIKLLDMILSVTPAAISVKDADGRLLLVNEAMTRVVGRPRGEIEGRLITEIFPADALRDVSLWDKIARGSPNSLVTGERVTPIDGVPRHMLSTRQACVIGDRELVVACATDITAIREAEAATQRAVATEAASRIKANFLANMSHELRTPLNAVIGFAEVMKSEMLGPIGTRTYLGYAGNIHTAGTHLLRVVNDILDLTKAEAKTLEMQLHDVEIGAVIDPVVQMNELAARAASVTLETDMHPDLIAHADGHRLRQVLMNLVSNAVKFTPAGGRVRISAAVERQEAVLRVEDTGVGMSAAEIAVALEPFGHVVSSFTRAHDGTGLGLPLAKRMVEMMHGRLDIDSTKGRGTRVTIRLPAAGSHANVA